MWITIAWNPWANKLKSEWVEEVHTSLDLQSEVPHTHKIEVTSVDFMQETMHLVLPKHIDRPSCSLADA